ncbi:MAG: hypothetical protein H8E44_05140 [Planctomycetes bacterium]|nr:hypothetical protein [Planctomycetota bacterium]MBL7037287.1 hypothetical protein [Pirellulaceae bacterium]
MRRSKQWATILGFGVLVALGHTTVQAEEPAATNELPLALRTLNVSDSNQLTCRQAHNVRGTGSLFATDGVIVQFRGNSQLPEGQFEWAGIAGGDSLTMAFDSNGLSFRAEGMAVISNDAPYQGVIATETGVFNGELLFQGGTSTLSIIAVPGMFAVDFR